MSQSYSLQPISQASIDRIQAKPELFALYHYGGDREYFHNLKEDEGLLSSWEKLRLKLGLGLAIPPFELHPAEEEVFHFECDAYQLQWLITAVAGSEVHLLHSPQQLTPFDIGWSPASFYSPQQLPAMLDKLSSVERELFSQCYNHEAQHNHSGYFSYIDSTQQHQENRELLWSYFANVQVFLRYCIKNQMGVVAYCI